LNAVDNERKNTMHRPRPQISDNQVPGLLPSLAAQDRHRVYNPYMSIITDQHCTQSPATASLVTTSNKASYSLGSTHCS